ncbi:MAG: glutamine-hydrolyzing GMP synthase, partial [Clostridia bacterium]|nr:glutamine-hydrolyzing GMP synthase [Clostridia bacterium]
MEKILVLDFGGQYNQLIARRVRDIGVYAEIMPYKKISVGKIVSEGYKGVIFTGGPNSVYDESSPHYSPKILNAGIPILGICYGCQLTAWMAGGTVSTAPVSEYGKITVALDAESPLMKGIPRESTVWMSHTDYISKVPEGFEIIAHSLACPCAAMQNKEKNLYAVQFHPEVTHTEYGKTILRNFIVDICGCACDWVMDDFIDDTVAKLKETIGEKRVILGLSGGVDSSVAAALLSRAIGDRLTCVFVDHGLMRKNEGDFVEQTFGKMFPMNFVRVNCADVFYEKLKGVTDP